MNKIIVFLILLTSLSTSSFAQLSGGLKAGLNYSDVIITNGRDYFDGIQFNPRASYHFGSYLQHSFSRSFAWQLEMLFSNKGYSTRLDDVKTPVSLNYLNWPILLVYHLNRRLDFETGLELGFMVSGDPQFNTFDMGIDLGVAYKINEKFIAGLRYNHGFPNQMNLNHQQSNVEIPGYQISTLQFYLGFNIISETKANE